LLPTGPGRGIKERMQIWRLVPGAALMVTLAACSSSSSNDSTGDGGATDAKAAGDGAAVTADAMIPVDVPPSPPPVAICPVYCNSITPVGCMNDKTCAADCTTAFGKVPTACQARWNSQHSCLANKAPTDFMCDATSGKAVAKAGICAQQMDAYMMCLMANPQ
jgi:hypothetical protein